MTAQPSPEWPTSVDRGIVFYVGGSGRSGSTLIGRIFGRLPGYVCVGEMVFLWTRGLVDDELCGCGEPFSACPFWVKVGERAFGGWDAVDGPAVEALQRSVDRHRYLPLMLGPRGTSYGRRLDEYTKLLTTVYAAVREVSGADVVVDTSKHPSYAYVLRRTRGVDLRLLHLVRDSRGVCHSWTREVARPEVRGAQAKMPTYSSVRAASEWAIHNLLFETLAMLRVPHRTVRYEDFVAHPLQIVNAVNDDLVGKGGQLAQGCITLKGVDLPADHSLSGNPMRFREGRIPLKVDDEWRTKMPARARRLVTALTLLGLRRYRYALSADKPPTSRSLRADARVTDPGHSPAGG
jgi:hypothetical protein